MNLYEKLENLKNLSFRYGQKNPDEVPNFYDKEISALFAEARRNGIELSEEGYTVLDDKSKALISGQRPK